MNKTEHDLTFGYGRKALDAAFKKVQNKKGWKYAVGAVIDEADFDVTSAAVIYFTGSVLQVTKRLPGNKIIVYADGYYVAVGA